MALPFLILLIYLGGVPFSLLIAIVTLIGLWEYFHIVLENQQELVRTPVPITGFCIGLLIILSAHGRAEAMIVPLMAFNVVFAGFLGLLRYKDDPEAMTLVMKQVLGVAYIALLLSQLVMLRKGPDGAAWIFFLLFLVFFGDIGAYYAGRYLGRHKLYPAASPGKTIEGALGGLVASMGIGLVFRWLFLPELPLWPCLIMFLCIGIAGPVGDLFESVLKRVGKVKDSGTILPGHGGLLDRIDALLFAAPVAYLFKAYILT